MFRTVIAERFPLAIAGRTTEEVWNLSRTFGANGTNRNEELVLLFRCEMSLSTERYTIFPSSYVHPKAYDFSISV